MFKKFLIISLVAICQLFCSNTYAQWVHPVIIYSTWDFAKQGDTLISATWQGLGAVYRSVDHGISWTPVASLGTSQCPAGPLAVSVQGNYLYAGDNYSGCTVPIYVSSNYGASWSTLYTLPAPGTIFSLVSDANFLYAAIEGDLFRSADHGNNWFGLTVGFPIGAVSIQSLLKHGNDLYVAKGSTGVYRSTNNGDTWSPVNNGITNMGILEIVADGNSVYAVSSDKIFVTNNNGTSWTTINTSGVPNSSVRTIAVSGNDLFVGNGQGTGVYHSADGGATWASLNTGLNSLYINKLFIDENNLICGHFDGISVYPNAICPASYSSAVITACNSYTSPSGNYVWSSSGTYTDTLSNSGGCDSIITISLTINSAPVILSYSGSLTFCKGDSVILNVQNTLNNYQWYRNNSGITGATTFEYTAKRAGNYFCIAQDSTGCSDSSNTITVHVPCIPPDPDQQKVIGLNTSLELFPNPSSGIVSIKSSAGTLSIINSIGQVLFTRICFEDTLFQVELDQGLYIITLQGNERSLNKRIVVN